MGMSMSMGMRGSAGGWEAQMSRQGRQAYRAPPPRHHGQGGGERDVGERKSYGGGGYSGRNGSEARRGENWEQHRHRRRDRSRSPGRR
jgi:hypothetical protein